MKRDPLEAAFEAEGARARRGNKKRTACPYSMGKAVTGGPVLRAHLIARRHWLAGWDAADASIKRRKDIKAAARRAANVYDEAGRPKRHQ